jgi:polyvinyl alcohol dehydrogenase (cytochrome)
VFSGSMDGHIRAYASGSGALLWDFDTARDYKPVNHPAGRGGSVNGHAQIVADGTLYVLSGAGVLSHPGNVLLAFTVDGR